MSALDYFSTATVQGGRRLPVKLLGRQGMRRVLVRYQIQSGVVRTRWLPVARVDVSPETLALLPLYVRRVCPAVQFTNPIVVGDIIPDEVTRCDRCGQQHRCIWSQSTYAMGQTVYWTGRRQLLLGIVPADGGDHGSR